MINWYRCTGIHCYRCTAYNGPEVQGTVVVQKYEDTVVQMYRDTIVQMYGIQWSKCTE